LWNARLSNQTNESQLAYSKLRGEGAQQGMKVGLTCAVARVTRLRDDLTQVM
jgi:hypothetical protein